MKISNIFKPRFNDIKEYHFYIKLDNTLIDKKYKWNKKKINFAAFCSRVWYDLDKLVRVNGFQDKNGVMTNSVPPLNFRPENQNLSFVAFNIIFRRYECEDVFLKLICIDDTGRYIEKDERYWYKHQPIPKPDDYLEELNPIE